MDPITFHGLTLISKSPLNYWWHYLNPFREISKPDKDALFKSALRMAFFSPEEYSKKYVVAPQIKKTTVAGKLEFAAIEKQCAENGQEIMSFGEIDLINKLVEELKKNPILSEMIKNGVYNQERKVFVPDCGVTVLIKPHFVFDEKIAIDLSVIDDVNDFSKNSVNSSNHVKAAVYNHAFQNPAIFVRIEKKAPYHLFIGCFDEKSVELGNEIYLKNCLTYAECCKSGKWIGDSEIIKPVSLPDWAFKK